MTIHFGKGTMTVKTVDGREHTFDTACFQFEPSSIVDEYPVVDERTTFNPVRLVAGVDTSSGRLEFTVFDARMRIADMRNELFREITVKPFVDEVKVQMVSQVKNKPYFRQFEKRGKW